MCKGVFNQMFGVLGEQKESQDGWSLGCVGWAGRRPDDRDGKDL